MATISKTPCGHYFVSIACEESVQLFEKTNKTTGVSLQNGAFVYQSNADWTGVDGFDVLVTDRAGASVGGHITVDVNGVKTPTPYKFVIKSSQ